jgi:hypothetical protein
LNLNPGYFDSFTFILILCGESHLLVSWSAGSKCDMADSDKDLGRSRRPGVKDRGWSSTGRVLGGQMIVRLGDVWTLSVPLGFTPWEASGTSLSSLMTIFVTLRFPVWKARIKCLSTFGAWH